MGRRNIYSVIIFVYIYGKRNFFRRSEFGIKEKGKYKEKKKENCLSIKKKVRFKKKEKENMLKTKKKSKKIR